MVYVGRRLAGSWFRIPVTILALKRRLWQGLPYQPPIIRGPNNESSPGGESSLDIQYIMGIGRNVRPLLLHFQSFLFRAFSLSLLVPGFQPAC